MEKHGYFEDREKSTHEPNGVILNTDANGSIPQVINTMLVFSRVGRIVLLPALPAAWPEGCIEGVRCRGNIELRSLAWSRESVRAELISAASQTIELRIPGEAVPRQVELPAGQMVTVEAKRP